MGEDNLLGQMEKLLDQMVNQSRQIRNPDQQVVPNRSQLTHKLVNLLDQMVTQHQLTLLENLWILMEIQFQLTAMVNHQVKISVQSQWDQMVNQLVRMEDQHQQMLMATQWDLMVNLSQLYLRIRQESMNQANQVRNQLASQKVHNLYHQTQNPNQVAQTPQEHPQEPQELHLDLLENQELHQALPQEEMKQEVVQQEQVVLMLPLVVAPMEDRMLPLATLQETNQL